jgi:hypothetical protein
MPRNLPFVLTVVGIVVVTCSGAWGAATGTTTGTGAGTTYGLSTLGSTGSAADIGGQISGSERFMNRAIDTMVGGTGAPVAGMGAAATGTTGATSPFGAGTMSPFGSRMFGSPFGGGMTSLYAAGMMNSLNNQRRQLRIPLRLGVDDGGLRIGPGVTGPAVSAVRLQGRLANNPRVKAMGSVAVAVEGQTAVLKGSVASVHDRQLLEKLLLLEPGVSEVRNELQVAAATKAPPPKP